MRADIHEIHEIHTTRSILVWSGLSLRPPGNDWVSVASARAFYYVFMCSEWALESWPGPRAPTRGPGWESSEDLKRNDEKTEEFRNVLCDNADLEADDKKCIFRWNKSNLIKSFFRIQFLCSVVPGGKKYAARSVMMSWLCHELLWSSRDSQHPTPGPVTRLCCRAEKKELEICGNIFLSLQVCMTTIKSHLCEWAAERRSSGWVSGEGQIILIRWRGPDSWSV